MRLAGREFAAPLYEAIGPEAFALVAEWHRDVASVSAVGVEENGETRVISSSVAWLAECVSFYEPEGDPQ